MKSGLVTYATRQPMVHLPLKKAFSAGRCLPGNMGHFKDVGNLKSLLRHLKAGKHGAEFDFSELVRGTGQGPH